MTTDASTLDTPKLADLQRQVRRLKAENTELRGRLAAPTIRARHTTSRAVTAVALVVLAALFLPVALTGRWLNTTLLDTDRYVAVVVLLAQTQPSGAAILAIVGLCLALLAIVEVVARAGIDDPAAVAAIPASGTS